jgi:hypothetical protein
MLGLVDPEYGRPVPVRAEEARSAADLAPCDRRHPVIYCGGRCIAMSTIIAECEMIRAGLEGSDR